MSFLKHTTFYIALLTLVNVSCDDAPPLNNNASSRASNVNAAIQTVSEKNVLTQTNVNLADLTQEKLHSVAQSIELNYQVIDNQPEGECASEFAGGQCFKSKITMSIPDALHGQPWSIYFSHIAPARRSTNDGLAIEHVNGDLHRLYPLRTATDNKIISVVFYSDFWHLSNSDIMPNYFIVIEGLKPEVLAVTDEKNKISLQENNRWFFAGLPQNDKFLKRGDTDNIQISDAQYLYQQYSNFKNIDEEQWRNRIVPMPSQILDFNADARLFLGNGITLKKNDFKANSAMVSVALQRFQRLGVPIVDEGVPVFITHLKPTNSHSLLADQSYELSVDKSSIHIKATTATGAFYGLMSVAALLDINDLSVTDISLKDKPRYLFRGLHIDVARNFHQKELLYKIIEQMAAYKLNKLHLHLGDDEGWRVEIPTLPELTQIASKRCFDLAEDNCLLPQLGSGPNADTSVNGYFSELEYKSILQYADAHQIEVIPSFDMPGHSRAAVKAMEARYRKLMTEGKPERAKEFLLTDLSDTSIYESVQYYHDNTINVCLPSSYKFVYEVISEIARMHKEAGTPLRRYHIGADETAGAWKNSPQCQNFIQEHSEIEKPEQLTGYFIETVAQHLAERGIIAAGWSDGMKLTHTKNMPEPTQVNDWSALFWQGHKTTHDLINRGWQVVASNPDVTYFDFPYEVDPEEPGYYWGSRRTNTQKVFQFMPDNLPAMAEVWRDRSGNRYQADDRSSKEHQPIKNGLKLYGVQGQFWSESIRDDTLVEYMLFPRLLALSERAWHKADWELEYDHHGRLYSSDTSYFDQQRKKQRDKDWRVFAATLGHKELRKLAKLDIDFRIPTVGAVLKSDKLYYRTAFPGFDIEVKQPDSDEWTLIHPNMSVTSGTLVRAVHRATQRVGRSIAVN
ncbi:family 20 glycosylhydrolase [Pleionea litopenaei]|uniref:beta-N-acetylhexosaminidase n=1 Tax=Pleionea litopenaei TaxID=3070815 RepID=A0AA51RS96_9GAMM|nr:family 20 glycosylhydrolase [Pleionea sp. HL-JVS1]WMS86655.1 family 20 glycosylhydrolase [Pleionea sp. HL-JVS1]